MPMKYIVDIHNTQNTASLQNFLQNNIDLSNNFFPGVDKQIGGKVQTYYAKPPYMLSANTAWLVPNTTKAPLNDAAFRRALAMSINVDQIVKADYGNIVAKANPTGLLPTWNKWIDKAPGRRSSGFKYNIAGAKALLAANGYKDTNGDGFVENKNGQPINLQLIVPNGWSDWMTAIQIIAAARRTPASRSRRPIPTTTGSSTSATRASSTSSSTTTSSSARPRTRTTTTSSTSRWRTRRPSRTTRGSPPRGRSRGR